MSPKFSLLLVLLKVVAGKYVYEKIPLNWFEAQWHCRTHHTDLAPVSSEYDTGLIKELNLEFRYFTYIGLMNTTESSSGWMWSGGGEVAKFFWSPGEPNGLYDLEDRGCVRNSDYSWNDISGFQVLYFICYSVHAVRERMTWDKALQYCRQNHSDLASVASETEMMLIAKELRKEPSSVNVWIGLHFLDGHWQWIDGQPFSYEAWGPLEKPVCPDITFACGALQVEGPGQGTVANVERVVGWNVLDCDSELHFLCY